MLIILFFRSNCNIIIYITFTLLCFNKLKFNTKYFIQTMIIHLIIHFRINERNDYNIDYNKTVYYKEIPYLN